MSILSAIWEAIPIEVKGAIMAAGMTLLRAYSSTEKRTIKAIMLEAAVCSGLTISLAIGLFVLFKIDLYFSIAIGGFLGYMGPAWVSVKLNSYVDKKTGK